jgi:hypothetical protein
VTNAELIELMKKHPDFYIQDVPGLLFKWPQVKVTFKRTGYFHLSSNPDNCAGWCPQIYLLWKVGIMNHHLYSQAVEGKF